MLTLEVQSIEQGTYFIPIVFTLNIQVLQRWFSLRHSSGFVDDKGINSGKFFQGFSIFNEHARLCTFSDADHNGHWSSQTQSTRTSDNQHSNGIHKGVNYSLFFREDDPDDKCQNGDTDNRRYKVSRDSVGKFLDWCLTSTGLIYHFNYLRQQGLGTYLFGLHQERGCVIYCS